MSPSRSREVGHRLAALHTTWTATRAAVHKTKRAGTCAETETQQRQSIEGRRRCEDSGNDTACTG